MQIPVSLGKPNRIQDAYIVLHLNHEIPYQILFGSFFQNVISNGNYQHINLPKEDGDISDSTNKILFYDEEIKFALDNKVLFLNIVDKYIGWNKYKLKLNEVLSFFNEDISIFIEKVELRYISLYENIDLKEITKFQFTFSQPRISSKKFRFTTEFDYEDVNVILNLVNKQTSEDNDNDLIKPFNSYIDIDLNKSDISLNIKDIENAISLLSNLNRIEKDIYFNLLDDNFLKSLDPKY